MTIRLGTFNVENLFARAKALDTDELEKGEPALAAFEAFNQVAAKPGYSDAGQGGPAGRAGDAADPGAHAGRARPNKTVHDAWAVLRENRGDFLVAPDDREPGSRRTGAGTGSAGWS